MQNFTAGQTLQTRFISDSDCKINGTVVKVTAKTVTVDVEGEGVKRCKIHQHNGSTFIYPLGRYSMAPIFRA